MERGLNFSKVIRTEEMDSSFLRSRQQRSFRDMMIDNVKDDNQPDIPDLEKTYEMARERREEFRGIFTTSVEDLRVKKGGLFYLSRSLYNVCRAILKDILTHPSAYLKTVFSYQNGNYRSDFLPEHSINVAILSCLVGEGMGINEADLQVLFISGLIHDLGMFRIDEGIINKPGELGLHERKFITIHPIEGAGLFDRAFAKGNDAGSSVTSFIKNVILQEHERADGSGYPYKLQKGEVSRFFRIIGMCDTIESLTHPRPYREAISPFMAFRRLTLSREAILLFGQDEWNEFYRCITPYPPGTRVTLSNRREAEVICINPEWPLNPVILLQDDKDMGGGRRIVDLKRNKIINLRNYK